LSQLFSWIAIIMPLIGALVVFYAPVPKWATVVVAVAVAAVAAAALYFRNVDANEKKAELAALKPRTLSATQKRQLVEQVSKERGTIRFIHRLMDGEGDDYGQQIAEAFKSAGWTVLPGAGNSLNDLPGMVAVVYVEPVLAPLAGGVRRALSSVGINSGGETKPELTGGPLVPGVIYVVMGRKP
jgi:hypothetical protein